MGAKKNKQKNVKFEKSYRFLEKKNAWTSQLQFRFISGQKAI